MRRLSHSGHIFATMLALLVVGLGACTQTNPLSEKSFVGNWHSSKSTTPIRLDENGEWELLSKDNKIIEYGVWQYFDNKLMWSMDNDGAVRHDVNLVISADAKEFKLRERDGSVTTFSRLN